MTEVELRPKRRTKMTDEEIAAQIEEKRKEDDYVSPLREDPVVLFPDDEPGSPVTNQIEPALDVFEFTDESIDRLKERFAIPRRRGLHEKLAEMLTEIGYVQKTGTAPPQMGGFKFTEASHLAEKIRASLSSKKISMLPEHQEIAESTQFQTKTGSTQFLVTIKTTWRVTDAESGETATFESFGSGQDGSDKALPKAQTNSLKYAMLMAWLVPQSDDPEAFVNEGPGDQPQGIVIESSNVEGIRQGGRSQHATAAQVDAIRRRARELALDPQQLVTLINSVTTDQIDLGPVAEDERVGFLIEKLGALSFEEASSIVQMLLTAHTE